MPDEIEDSEVRGYEDNIKISEPNSNRKEFTLQKELEVIQE